MSIAVVTSCSSSGWDEYGRRFCESFGAHWPGDVPLYVVSEDDLPLCHAVTLQLDLRRHPPAAAFFERHRGNARAHGRVLMPGDVGWSEKKRAARYNFRYDAFRFAKKVFAIEMVAELVPHGRLFWVDADVLTFAAVPREFLEQLLPADKALCCLERGESYHSECGFVGYNLDHDLGPVFIQEFAQLYASDRVFKLHEWHDSWVFDWLRRKLEVPVKPIAHCSRHQPFVNSKLGRYLDHLKGANKQLGKTPSRLLSTNRDVPYWRDNP